MLRILLVEDSPDDAELLRFALDDAGIDHELRRVWSRAALLEVLGDFAPSVAVSDLHLPGFCGAEALRLVQAQRPGLPMVLLSGAPAEAPGDLPARVLDKAALHGLPALLRGMLAA